MKYTTLFFDLDHTLWDFDINSHEVLCDIFSMFLKSNENKFSFEDFYKVYHKVNDEMWARYRNHNITKDELRNDRFYETLLILGINNRKLADDIGDYYVKTSPYKTNLFEGSHKVLSELKQKYSLNIITNGFEEVQLIKLKNCKLTDYFDHIITSEKVGFNKPHPKIFEYSLQKCMVNKEQVLMIGDGLETDIIGAKNSGIDQVFFNPQGIKDKIGATYVVGNLNKLLEIL